VPYGRTLCYQSRLPLRLSSTATASLVKAIQWFLVIGDEPDDETGFWMVEANVCDNGQPNLAIIHLDSIYRAAHLVPAYRSSDFTMHDTLD
jgi:hypothetical protein